MRNLLLYFALICAAACNTSPFGIDSGEKNDDDSTVDEGKIRFSFGLRNFREINEIMHSKTGTVAQQNTQGHSNSEKKTPVAAAAVTCEKKVKWHGGKKSYTSLGKGKIGKLWCSGVKDLLPKSSNVLSLTGPTQVGIFKLASEYCHQLMQNNNAGKQARTQKLPTVAEQLNALQMTKRPADIDSSLQNSLAAALVDNFHGEGLSVRPDVATTKSDLAKLMAELINTQEEQGNKQASNQEVLVGACTAALASAQMVFH